MEASGVASETPAATPSVFHLGYQPGLDGIRAVSLILIMLFHSFILWPAALNTLVPGAYIAVNMFFVLSGFLITALLLEERARHDRISFRSFYERRGLRLLPALVFILAVHLAYTAVVGNPFGPELAAIGWISVYAANWARWAGKMDQLATALTWGHMWTLSVEEQFYLVWPALVTLVFAFRPKLRTVGWLLVAAVIAVTVERAFFVATLSLPAGVHDGNVVAQHLERIVGIRTDLRADTLLLGALAAVLLHSGWRPNRFVLHVASAFFAAFIVAAWVVQPDARWMYAWGFTVVDAGVALMCVAVLDRRWLPGHLLRSPPFPWIGRLSYALYLWHPPVFVAVVTQAPEWPVGVKLVAGWAITFGFAIVSYYCVETPFLRLKGRLSSSAHGPEKAAQTAEPAASQA